MISWRYEERIIRVIKGIFLSALVKWCWQICTTMYGNPESRAAAQSPKSLAIKAKRKLQSVRVTVVKGIAKQKL